MSRAPKHVERTDESSPSVKNHNCGKNDMRVSGLNMENVLHALAKMDKQVGTLQMNMGVLKHCIVEISACDELGHEKGSQLDNEGLEEIGFQAEGKGLVTVVPKGPIEGPHGMHFNQVEGLSISPNTDRLKMAQA